jgi:uncharacterized protein
MELGKVNKLKLVRFATIGGFLANEEGEEVLCPEKYLPEGVRVGDELDMIVYKDSEDRIIATSEVPFAYVDEIEALEIVDITRVGAFAKIGLLKDLMIPFKEQHDELMTGRKYLIKVMLDERSDRLIGTTRLSKHFSNANPTVEKKDYVDYIVWRHSDLGYMCIINNKHVGLILERDVVKRMHIGKRGKAYVKNINHNNEILLSLQKVGYKAIDDFSEVILQALSENEGVLELDDKSSPEEINLVLGLSKKAFKKGVGSLLKDGVIEFVSEGIKLKD